MIENIILCGIALYISIKLIISGYKHFFRKENANKVKGIIYIAVGMLLLIFVIYIFYIAFVSEIHIYKRKT